MNVNALALADDDAAFRAVADASVNGHGLAASDACEDTWRPVALGPIVAGIEAGNIVGPVPALLHRSDGVALLYPGEVHSIAGEPEAGKGWINLATATQTLATGGAVLYLDFEDSAASIVGRLLALGASPASVVDRFVYVKPEDQLLPGMLDHLLVRPFALAIIDGLSEAYALLGLDYTSNTDVPNSCDSCRDRSPRPARQSHLPTTSPRAKRAADGSPSALSTSSRASPSPTASKSSNGPHGATQAA